MGGAPIITDGDLTLPESGAIVDYIIGKYGNGRLAVTADRPNFADYLYWFHFANGSMMPRQQMGRPPTEDESPRARMMRERAETTWTLMEARLGQSPYFAGDELTAADIMLVFGLTTMRAFAPRDLAPYPNIRAYLQRIGARPAYQRAMAKGDPKMTPMLT
jgi:glutathione S-transferase